MSDVYAGYEKLRPTPKEDKKNTAEMMAHMKKKFITDRTPAKFKKRALALASNMAQAATELGVEDQTFRRWCRGDTAIPGVAWVALQALEKLKKLEV